MDMRHTLNKNLVRALATGVMGFALTLTACNDDSSTSPPAAAAPELAITEPAEGATVGTALTIKVSPENFKVVAPGANKTGEGHLHYLVDGGTYNALADTSVTL
jgi:hypothetical protein